MKFVADECCNAELVSLLRSEEAPVKKRRYSEAQIFRILKEAESGAPQRKAESVKEYHY